MKAMQVNDLYCFRDGSSRLIHGFSLEAEAGDSILIQGSDLQRKVLFECLTGLRNLDKGQVLVCGQNLSKLRGKELARFRCQHIGAAYSENGFVPEFSIMENLCLPLIASGKREAEAKDRIRWLTQKVLSVDMLYRRPQHLSPFQLSAAALIRAVSCEQELLILGDLFGGLDEVLERLRALVSRAALARDGPRERLRPFRAEPASARPSCRGIRDAPPRAIPAGTRLLFSL